MLGIMATKAEKLSNARNTLTQKTLGNKGIATVMVDYREISQGQRMGMACLGENMVGAGVEKVDVNGYDKIQLYFEYNGNQTILHDLDNSKKRIWIRLNIDAINNKHQFSYSTDGKQFINMGQDFEERNSAWKGSRVGLYSYTDKDKGGMVYFDNFEYKVDGPGKLK